MIDLGIDKSLLIIGKICRVWCYYDSDNEYRMCTIEQMLMPDEDDEIESDEYINEREKRYGQILCYIDSITQDNIDANIRNNVFCNWTDDEYERISHKMTPKYFNIKIRKHFLCSIEKLRVFMDKNKNMILGADSHIREQLDVDSIEKMVAKCRFRVVNNSGESKVFDNIVVAISLLQGDNGREEMFRIVKNNMNYIRKIVIDFVKDNRSFIKYGVPASFLKIDRIIFTMDNVLEVYLGLKEV